MIYKCFFGGSYIVLLLILLAVSGPLNAQMFEELKKEETVSDARVVVTVYSGIGFSMYTYDGNTPSIIGIETREFKTGLSVPVNVNLLFRKNNLSFGPGLDYQHISIRERQFITPDPLSIGIVKVVGRMEIQPRAGKNLATSGFLQAGPGMAINPPGTSPAVLFGLNLGSLWTARISRSAAFVFGMSMGFDFFKNQVNKEDSRHRAIQYGLILGLRFGKTTS